MIRVAAITSSRTDPSSRFRMRQFLEPLRAMQIDATEYCPWIDKYASAPWQLTGLGVASRLWAAAVTRTHDVAWLNRELVTGRETIEGRFGRRRLLDVDDAIWLDGRRDFARSIAGKCAGVIAGNARIAEYFAGFTPMTWIVPTSVDTTRWCPAPHADRPFTIGWSGTAWNYKYLYPIENELQRFLKAHTDARLLIVSDRMPEFSRLVDFDFERWSPESEVAAVQRMDVALMPLEDNEWTRAKCALKMLCAMSVGVPVIASPIGAAAEILGKGCVGIGAVHADDWYEALGCLYRDRSRASRMGIAGRQLVEREYSAADAVRVLASVFRSVAAS